MGMRFFIKRACFFLSSEPVSYFARDCNTFAIITSFGYVPPFFYHMMAICIFLLFLIFLLWLLIHSHATSGSMCSDLSVYFCHWHILCYFIYYLYLLLISPIITNFFHLLASSAEHLIWTLFVLCWGGLSIGCYGCYSRCLLHAGDVSDHVLFYIIYITAFFSSEYIYIYNPKLQLNKCHAMP